MLKITVPNFENFKGDPRMAYEGYHKALEQFEEIATLMNQIQEQKQEVMAQTDRALQLAKESLADFAAEQERNARLLALVLKLEKLVFGVPAERLDGAQLLELRLAIAELKF